MSPSTKLRENQQPSVTQELGIRFCSTKGGGRRVEADSSLGLVLVNHLLQELIQIILVLQHGLPQNSKATSKKPRKSMSHKTTSEKTPRKFPIFYHVKSSDSRFVIWSMSIPKFGLPRL